MIYLFESETLLIVGASARAAAQSALRYGCNVATVDLFADVDLAAIAQVTRIDDYPYGLVAAVAQAPPGPWLYTGGLENYPDVVAAISRDRHLLGNGPNVLERCRDWSHFRLTCELAALPVVPSCDLPGNVPQSGKWLLKPRASAGGQGITLFQQPPYPIAQPTQRWEAFVEGTAHGAVYVADETSTHLLGVTEQLAGTDWTGASGFQYAGSISSPWVKEELLTDYKTMGEVFAREYQLRGLFGIDTIVSPYGQIFPLEINPRYTASVEVLERARGLEFMPFHVAACRDGVLPWLPAFPANADYARSVGKAVVYARQPANVSQAFVVWCLLQNKSYAWPTVADIPQVGTQIEAGQPIVTVFAEARTTEDLRLELRKLSAAVHQWLS